VQVWKEGFKDRHTNQVGPIPKLVETVFIIFILVPLNLYPLSTQDIFYFAKSLTSFPCQLNATHYAPHQNPANSLLGICNDNNMCPNISRTLQRFEGISYPDRVTVSPVTKTQVKETLVNAQANYKSVLGHTSSCPSCALISRTRRCKR